MTELPASVMTILNKKRRALIDDIDLALEQKQKSEHEIKQLQIYLDNWMRQVKEIDEVLGDG